MNASEYLKLAEAATDPDLKEYLYAMYLSMAVVQISLLVPESNLKALMPEIYIAFGETLKGDDSATRIMGQELARLQRKALQKMN